MIDIFIYYLFFESTKLTLIKILKNFDFGEVKLLADC